MCICDKSMICTENCGEERKNNTSLLLKGKPALSLPVAEEDGAGLPLRSKNARNSESPKHFSGTARRTA